ncbi:ribosomal-processing cysteine protease Prp [Geomicrobium sp. JCM 19039]|uniref:ribosomal-processing cysteine protease Prp n=1 Tax=Geomicrobium sp. JCM 19039 TaxID=1460636 RepID=UPI00045F2BBF|nr:ribosomal-processing cysteine protease Prp [Geomicrobium sp. JCM 19039]GAK12605.1 potential ribosomal protein [Geomicrobium sp. JCM 19039]
MIRLTIVRNEENRTIHSFELSGHANAAEYGEDIVCAGVSAVAIGTVNAIEALCEQPLTIQSEDDGGYLYGEVPHSWTGRVAEDGQLLLEGMVVALKSIQQSYDEFIHVIEISGGADKC